MYQDRIMLTVKDIFEKEFKLDTRGYRPQEVDKFLDMVIRDYTEFMSIIKKLEVENRNLTSDLNKLKGEYRKLRDNIETASEGGSGSSNLDLLRRLSKLEKIVYGNND